LQSDSFSSPNHSSSSPNNLHLPEIDVFATSDENEGRNDAKQLQQQQQQIKNVRQPKRNSKKSKLIPEIESLPEDETFDMRNPRKHLPSPLILKKV
jgi:hypothetical protein